jgi:Skp family chaperone for outer membrane proteins
MNDEELKNLIDKKVTEAKLDVAEKRLNYVLIIGGGLVGLFGILFPLLTASANTDKIDSAISRMDSRLESFDSRASDELEKMKRDLHDEISDLKEEFNSLSSEQYKKLNDAENKLDVKIKDYENKFNEITNESYRKPNLTLLFNDKTISDTIYLKKHYAIATFKLLNDGDAKAKNIQVYCDYQEVAGIYISPDYSLYGNYSTKEGYQSIKMRESFELDAGLSDYFNLSVGFNNEKPREVSVDVTIRIYYEQPKPLEYNFTLKTQ